MRRIAIQDANILIDLVKTGIFETCLGLSYQFATTNIVLEELFPYQQELITPYINSGRFISIQISAAELNEIDLLTAEDTRMSIQDWSALYFAIKKEAILITGDKYMRAMAKKKAVEYHGIFWLFDELVENGTVSPKVALTYLEAIMNINKRLPSEEYKKRKIRWSG